MYGVLQATGGSNPLRVDDENEFTNALKPTQVFEWNQGTCEGNKYEIICITIQLLMYAITPLNQMQKTSFNLGANNRKTSPNAMKLNKITPNAYVLKIKLI